MTTTEPDPSGPEPGTAEGTGPGTDLADVTQALAPPEAGPEEPGAEEPRAQDAQPVRPGVARGRADRRELLGVGLFMFGAALAFFHGAWVHPSSTQIGPGGDADEYAWFMAWVPYALGHGLDPLVSTYVNAPHGINLMWNTSVLLPSFLASPFTVLFGGAFSYNLLMTLAPATTGLACYWAFRRWTAPLASFAGALVTAFSPYLFSQSYGHMAQTVLVSAPLLLVALDRVLVVQGSAPWKDGLWLGALVWAQLVTGEEVLAMEAVAVLAGLVVLVAVRWLDVGSRWRHAAKGLSVAAVTAGVLSTPFLAVQFLGPYKVQSPHPPNVYVSDLFNFFVPTSVTRIVPGSAARVAAAFTGNVSEQGAYIGVPLLVFVLATVVMARRRPIMWAALSAGVVAAVLSMGQTLHWDGHITSDNLPYQLLGRLPLFNNLLPDRFASMTSVALGLVVALGCDELRRRRPAVRAAGTGVVLAGMAAIFPTTSFPAAASPIYQAFSTSLSCPQARSGTGGPPVALVVPSVNEMDLRWQSEAGFCFVMPSDTGMTGTNSGDIGNLGLLLGLGQPGQPLLPTTPQARRQAAAELGQLHISEVIVGPEWPAVPGWTPQGQANAVAWLQWLLGRPPVTSHDPYLTYVWRQLPPLARVASGNFS